MCCCKPARSWALPLRRAHARLPDAVLAPARAGRGWRPPRCSDIGSRRAALPVAAPARTHGAPLRYVGGGALFAAQLTARGAGGCRHGTLPAGCSAAHSSSAALRAHRRSGLTLVVRGAQLAYLLRQIGSDLHAELPRRGLGLGEDAVLGCHCRAQRARLGVRCGPPPRRPVRFAVARCRPEPPVRAARSFAAVNDACRDRILFRLSWRRALSARCVVSSFFYFKAQVLRALLPLRLLCCLRCCASICSCNSRWHHP